MLVIGCPQPKDQAPDEDPWRESPLAEGRVDESCYSAHREHDDRLSTRPIFPTPFQWVKRVRVETLRSSELSDPTITIASLGKAGSRDRLRHHLPPQAALVGFGKIVERPWVVDGKVEPRPVITAMLSADYRVTDGHRGGIFLAAVDRLLQKPEQL
ncbi:MAG: hypothetical protein C4293_13970 [Nitrospiraceae bacterium]